MASCRARRWDGFGEIQCFLILCGIGIVTDRLDPVVLVHR